MLEEGDMETGTLAAGQCMGLIRDIPTCKELLDRIMDQAESIIREKYSQLS
jgi:NAD(P)H-dependent flavin oxidoreductase YrpB (nitropropane dioxygenase family)